MRWERLASIVASLMTITQPVWANAVDDYEAYLDQLNRKDVRAISQAVTAYKSRFTLAKPLKEREAAFVAFRGFFYAMALPVPQQVRPAQQKANGLVILTSEGQPYLGEDSTFMATVFAPYVSAPMRQFLAIRQRELQEGFSDDAAIMIPFAKLGDRIATWERFTRQYPRFALANEVAMLHDTYLDTFLNGLDNTPIFDWDSKRIRPEVKQAYQGYVTRHADTPSAGLIREFLTVLKASGGKSSPKTQQFVDKHRATPFRGKLPPLR